MQRYYAQRAQIYERIFHKPERQADLRAMEAWLPPQFAARRVMEIACGTGWWTPHAAALAASWLATDVNAETLAIARSKSMPAARVVMLDNRYVAGSSTAIARRDSDGNTYQTRALDDGSTHEVLKNFPSRDEAIAAIGPEAREPQWIEHPHYWILSYILA